MSKAKAYLKWHPVYNLQEAVDTTIQWYKEFYLNKNNDMHQYILKQIENYEKEVKNKIYYGVNNMSDINFNKSTAR